MKYFVNRINRMLIASVNLSYTQICLQSITIHLAIELVHQLIYGQTS